MSRHKAEFEAASNLLAAERGGRLKERQETAREMKADGVPYETIAKYTKLTFSEIDSL
jgi:hypothetical protein